MTIFLNIVLTKPWQINVYKKTINSVTNLRFSTDKHRVKVTNCIQYAVRLSFQDPAMVNCNIRTPRLTTKKKTTTTSVLLSLIQINLWFIYGQSAFITRRYLCRHVICICVNLAHALYIPLGWLLMRIAKTLAIWKGRGTPAGWRLKDLPRTHTHIALWWYT